VKTTKLFDVPDDRKASVIAIEVDRRERCLFEADTLLEMLGASRLLDQTVDIAARLFPTSDGLCLFQQISGEIRAWASRASRELLLHRGWRLREWLISHGIEHTAVYFEVDRRHFEDNEAGCSMSHVQQEISHALAVARNAKQGSDAMPACSFFALCQLHGSDPANRWQPNLVNEPRRHIRSYRAAAKERYWNTNARQPFYADSLRRPVWKRVAELTGREVDLEKAISFSDLTERLDDPSQEDQSIAYLCAEADDIRRVWAHLNWNSARWDDGLVPWTRHGGVARQLSACVKDAFTTAVVACAVDEATALRLLDSSDDVALDLPVLPQLLNGEKLWTLASPASALDIACTFTREFARRAGDATHCPELAKAFTRGYGHIRSVGLTGGRLSIVQGKGRGREEGDIASGRIADLAFRLDQVFASWISQFAA
jgi:hypothetical protein